MGKDRTARKGIAVIIALLTAAAAAITVYAYLGDQQKAVNTFSIAEGSASIHEEFSSPDRQTDSNLFEKKVSVVNTGTSDCFVRVYMDFSDSRIRDISKLSYDGENYYTWQDFLTHLPLNWRYCSDDNELGGYFYYMKILGPGEETPQLITNIITVYQSGNIDDISDFDIVVYSETVQTVDTDGTEYKDSDIVFKDSDCEKAWKSFLKITT